MTNVKRLYFLSFVLLLITITKPLFSQSLKLALAKSEQPVKEEVRINYSNIPALTGKQFYTLFIFGSGGGSYHDSRPLNSLPSGTVTLNPIQKAGSFDIVLYKYEDISDAKPKQVARVPFKAVVSKTTVGNAPVTTASSTAKEIAPPREQPKPVAKKESGSGTSTASVINKPAPAVGVTTKKQAATQTSGVVPNNRSTFNLRPNSSYDIEEEITLHYDLPPLSESQFYTLAICRPEDTYTINISPELKQESGSITLKPIYQAGIYEFRVYRGDKSSSRKEELLHRQPISIGSVNKSFPGRYQCSEAAPKTFGTPAKGAPGADVIMPLLTRDITQQKVQIWLKPEDICVEYFSIQFLSPSSVKVMSRGRSSTMSSFPVKVRYKYAVNDFVNKKATVAEEGTDKVFHFYRDASKNWAFVEVKASESARR